MKRFFINQKTKIPRNSSSGQMAADFILEGQEHHHLANVLRIKQGEHVVVCYGDEYDYIFIPKTITKNYTKMHYVQSELNKANPKVKLTAFIPLIKYDNLSLIIQKLNELGISEVFLYSSANCNLASEAVNIEKLRNIAFQSCKQCERSVPLLINEAIYNFKETAKNISKNYVETVFLDEHEQKLLLGKFEFTTEKNNNSKYAFILGPEGGLTDTECSILYGTANIKAVSLGKRILRAETAAIAAASIIMSKLGEM